MAETSKERLTEIEERQSYTERDGLDYSLVRVDDFNWLIDQAKRSQELEKLIKSHAPEGRNYTNRQYVRLIREFTRIEEALEFYANKDNYSHGYHDLLGELESSVEMDEGLIARQAIEEVERQYDKH